MTLYLTPPLHPLFLAPPSGAMQWWPFSYRRAVCTLLTVAVKCFDALAPPPGGSVASSTPSTQPVGGGSTPSISTRHQFLTSFANLFNYEHGHLGAHQDRCLVTPSRPPLDPLSTRFRPPLDPF
jgi:hypothetical protein